MHRKLLYYCQSLVGMGHLISSLRIARALLDQGHDVDFIQGGLDVRNNIEHPNYRNLKLPTLLHDSDTGGIVDADGGTEIDELWQARTAAMTAFMRPPYDALVIEFFPFGRRRFRREIYTLFDAVRATSSTIPIFCNVREVLIPADDRTEQRIVAMVNRDIHTIFVRGDPDIVRLDETFAHIDAIRDKVVYTGYVAPEPPDAFPPRRMRILVSQGGGELGPEMLRAAIRTAPLLPNYRFLVAASSRTSPEGLAALRAEVRSDNVEIVPFLPDFQRHLLESALSINLGGDNTLMDVITTRTPSLAYPSQDDSEQGFRIDKLAAAGFVHPIGPGDLEPDCLRAKIERVLATPYPERPIATDGARVTAERIGAVLDQSGPQQIPP